MVQIHRLRFTPPLINTSSAFSSNRTQLQELFDCPLSGGVTTRTATLSGFLEDASHTVAFTKSTVSSINSYGYSPHPLSFYLDIVESILRCTAISTKPFIISITCSTASELQEMLVSIQDLRRQLDDQAGQSSRIGIEFNCSCPNIVGHPPPAYDMPSLRPLLQIMADSFSQDPTLTIGLKLPPYCYASQFTDVVKEISTFTKEGRNPFAFFTCTNTLGNSLLFSDEVTSVEPEAPAGSYAVPTTLGGLAGEAIHPLSLGNVHSFSRLLKQTQNPEMNNISIIGAGGVTDSAAVERMRRAGASVVGFATLLGREGIQAFEILSASGASQQ